MIRLTDASLLAFTKLRSHKLRNLVTILLASTLFGVLIAASLMMNGLLSGIDLFRKEGLASRYIVSVSNAPTDTDGFYKVARDPQLIARAKERYESIVAQKTAEAKRLGIPYSHISDTPPYSQTADGTTRLSVNDTNGIVQQLLKERYSTAPAFDDNKLSKTAGRYGAVNLFTEELYAIKKGASLSPLIGGQEHFSDQSDETAGAGLRAPSLVNSSSMAIAPSSITDPFTLPNNAGWKPDETTLPIILPQNVIEQLLSLEKLPTSATGAEKFQRLRLIRDNITNLTFTMCYRNSTSQALIQQAIQQKKEMAANRNNKNYQKPALIYGLPDPTKCQNAVVISDTRTVVEKDRAAKQALFDAKFGKETAPVSRLISFKVVGMSPGSSEVLNPEQEQQKEKARTASDILADLLRTEGLGQAIPRNLYDQLPNKAAYADLLAYEPLYLLGNEDNKQRFVEFATASDAQRFINEQSCTVQYDNTCKPAGNPYIAHLAFSNSAALDDLRAIIQQWSLYVGAVIMALAMLIMWIAIGRTIVDSRHETAVFRAIGFKRADIAIIYLLYAVLLSIIVAIAALGMGFAIAHALDAHFGSHLTAQAQYGFGTIDTPHTIRLVGINTQHIGFIMLACVTIGLLSALPPLLRNARRSPIRDMREL